MRVIAWLLVYLAAVFIGGALLGPLLYDFSIWAGHFWPAVGELSRKPFHRFVDRAVLGVAIIGLWPFLRKFQMFDPAKLGLSHAPAGHSVARGLRQWSSGFLVGFLSLALVAWLGVLFGARQLSLNHPAAETLHTVLGAAITAILVAFLEEIMFRGALYGVLRQPLGRAAAVIVSSVIYAAAHFVQKAEAPTPIAWDSGLRMLPAMFRNLGDASALIPAFFTLTVVGVILAVVYESTGTLYASIGLHGGWIFWLKSYQFTTRPAVHGATPFWGTDKLVDGWVSLIVLTGVLAIALARSKDFCWARQSRRQ